MEPLVIALAFFAAFFGALLIGERALRARRGPEEVPVVRHVQRYEGCVTCEGAEWISTAELMRHQARDHGTIRWA